MLSFIKNFEKGKKNLENNSVEDRSSNFDRRVSQNFHSDILFLNSSLE